ncbi:MAG: dynamin family protein [Hyphomicrobiaceae bacterium]
MSGVDTAGGDAGSRGNARASSNSALSPAEWDPMELADALYALRTGIDSSAERLAAALIMDLGTLVADARDLVAQQSCTVAVIGQIKSGKSTFINSWFRQPGLLPTSVDPWTTSITRLRLGQAGPGGIKARFTFFDRDEWKAIATDGGLVRDLTRRFVQGFEPELLTHHLVAMKRRSEARLGSELEQILGTQHDYTSLTRSILDRYVCAGPMTHEGEAEGVGRYSDVTRQADIFVEADSDVFPITIVDTPGTNDPFLVRDEITRRALVDADIHILVVSARQALSVQDCALVKILLGLNKREIVIFVNRIDELPEPARDVPELRRRVSAQLAREFPELTVDVVFGSAKWAELAMLAEAGPPGAAIDARIVRYATSLQATNIAFVGKKSPVTGPHLGSLAEVYGRCSGFADLEDALRAQIRRSRPARILGQTITTLIELGELNRAALSREIASEMRLGELDMVSVHQIAEELTYVRELAYQIENLTKVVQAVLDDLRTRGQQAVNEHAALIGKALHGHVAETAAKVGVAFAKGALGSSGTRLNLDTDRLRHQFKAIFDVKLAEANAALDELEHVVIPGLVELMVSSAPGTLAQDYALPSTSGLQPADPPELWQPISLELGEPWWRRWWDLALDKERRRQKLEAVVIADFSPIAEALETVAAEHLKHRQARIAKNAAVIFIGLAEQLRRNTDTQLQRATELNAQHAEIVSGKRGAARLERRMDLERRLADTTQSLAELNELEAARRGPTEHSAGASDVDVASMP